MYASQSSRVVYADRRGCRAIVGSALALMAITLFAAPIAGLILDNDRGILEYLFLGCAASFFAVMAIASAGFGLLQRAVVIDVASDSVEAGWYVVFPVFVERHKLSEFGAITLAASGTRAFDGHGPQKSCFHVCLVRGDSDEAAQVAGSMAPLHHRLLIVQAAEEDVEKARQSAARLSRLTRLPFGHPTLGPDAPDPKLRSLDLEPSLRLLSAERPRNQANRDD